MPLEDGSTSDSNRTIARGARSAEMDLEVGRRAERPTCRLREEQLNTSRASVVLMGVAPSAACLADTGKQLNPATLTCGDFVVLEDAYKPQVVYWVDGVNKKGKIQKEDVLMVGQDKTIATLVEECKKTPKQSFMQKVKAFFSHGKATISKTYAHN
jgi:acid stress chaperone HdeA